MPEYKSFNCIIASERQLRICLSIIQTRPSTFNSEPLFTVICYKYALRHARITQSQNILSREIENSTSFLWWLLKITWSYHLRLLTVSPRNLFALRLICVHTENSWSEILIILYRLELFVCKCCSNFRHLRGPAAKPTHHGWASPLALSISHMAIWCLSHHIFSKFKMILSLVLRRMLEARRWTHRAMRLSFESHTLLPI